MLNERFEECPSKNVTHLMRLLECKPDGDLVFHEFTNNDAPAYVILSHTWLPNKHTRLANKHTRLANKHTRLANKHTRLGNKHTRLANKNTRLANKHTRLANKHTRLANKHTLLANKKEEVSFQNVKAGTGKSKEAGWKKIRFCAEQTAAYGLQHFWIDTCCIDQSNKKEVANSIKSMYSWYAQSKKCIVYLADVDELDPKSSVEDQMRAARWFTRGWTLQELIAPKEVEFYSSNHKLLGTKRTYSKLINEITKIPVDAFCNKKPLSAFSLAQRFHWRSGRSTERPEDTAYCLLAILEVDIKIIYGGENQAFSRLLSEVARKGDQSGAAPRRTLTHDPSLWPSTEIVPSLAQVPDEQLDAPRRLVKRIQVGLEKDFKFGMFVMNHHRYDVAEETFKLARKDAEDAVESTQDGSMVRHRDYSLCRLGNLSRRQHRYNEAKQKWLTALASQEMFGHEASVFETLNNLGTVCLDLGQLDQAEKYFQESEMGRRKLLEANKADLQAMINWIKSFDNLVSTRYKQQGNLLEAEEAYENVLREVEKWPERSELGLQELQIWTGIGSLYLKEREGETHMETCGRARRAKGAFEKSRDAWVKKAKAEWAGVDPFVLKYPQSTEPAYLRAIEGLGRAHALLGEDSEAADCFKQAFEGFLTNNHADIRLPAGAFAVFHFSRGYPENALQVLDKALSVLREHRPPDGEGIQALLSLRRDIRARMLAKGLIKPPRIWDWVTATILRRLWNFGETTTT